MSFLTGPMHLHLNGHKDLTAHCDVLEMPAPDVLWVPLVNGNAPCVPLVKEGDVVQIGTKIAERNDNFYLPIFSPVSGIVVGIEKRMSSSMKPVDHLKIENDHKNTMVRAFPAFDYQTATWDMLLDFVKNAGLLGLGGAGFPTYVKFSKPENVETFIINTVECEPYLTSDYANTSRNLDLLKVGVLAFLKLSKAPKALIGIKEDKKDLIAKLNETFVGTNVTVAPVKDIYPAGWERTLVYMLTAKRYNKLPIEAGCIVSNVSTAIALGDAILNGMPIVKKYVTVSGDGIQKPQNVLVTIGTPVAEVVKVCGGYTADDCLLIAGGPMMGKAITSDTFVVSHTCNGLTVLKTRKEFTVACLRCGKCTETCPAGLEPVRINNCEKIKDIDTLKKLDTMSCIECGLCTYVCPSKIDVTEGVRRAKRYMALVK